MTCKQVMREFEGFNFNVDIHLKLIQDLIIDYESPENLQMKFQSNRKSKSNLMIA